MVEENSSTTNQYYFRMRLPFVENLEMLKGKNFIIKNNYWSLRVEALKNYKPLIEQVVKSNLKIELVKEYILLNKRKYSVHLIDILEGEGKFGLRCRDAVIKRLKKMIWAKITKL